MKMYECIGKSHFLSEKNYIHIDNSKNLIYGVVLDINLHQSIINFGSPAKTLCLGFDKNHKNPHVSMCRTYSPYKIEGDYYSL